MQGDVIALADETGAICRRYAYDAWGKITSITTAAGVPVSEISSADPARANPFRYRSYFYDDYTNLYQLESRYYDPGTGRFVNADGQMDFGSITGTNMFTYCGNNPVMRIDPTGQAWWHWAIAGAVVVVAAVAVVVTAGGAAAAIGAVAAVGSGMTAATTAATVAAGAFIGASMVLGGAVLIAASNSKSISDFNAQGNWGIVAATAGGAVLGGGSAYCSARKPKTKVYRSVGTIEARDIKATGQFNLLPGGMESKQFGFSLSETRQFGNWAGQNTIVSAKIPTNMLNQFYTGGIGGIDNPIFRSGTLTVYGDQLNAFNQAVAGTIKIMP